MVGIDPTKEPSLDSIMNKKMKKIMEKKDGSGFASALIKE